MSRLTPVRRATRTRVARRKLNDTYPQTAGVVRAIAEGWLNHEITREFDLALSSVSALRANVTRGTYRPFVTGNIDNGFRGSCNF